MVVQQELAWKYGEINILFDSKYSIVTNLYVFNCIKNEHKKTIKIFSVTIT